MGKSDRTLDYLIHRIRYQYPGCPSTFSECSETPCRNSARGGGKCADCLTYELGELTGRDGMAREFHEHTRSAAQVYLELQDCLDQSEAPHE